MSVTVAYQLILQKLCACIRLMCNKADWWMNIDVYSKNRGKFILYTLNSQ